MLLRPVKYGAKCTADTTNNKQKKYNTVSKYSRNDKSPILALELEAMPAKSLKSVAFLTLKTSSCLRVLLFV